MTTMPPQYFHRFDPAKEYDEHLFIPGRGLQSAELNELQKSAAYRLRGVADALFKDGDIVRDAVVVVDDLTGVVQCASGAIYINGAVRGVAPATFTIPVVGTFAIGVRLVETVVTSLQDPELRDPATGTRNYNEPGAERLRTHSFWGWSEDGGDGEFFPVYTVTDTILGAKEPPPQLDPVTQALARYDRDSAGGTYVVSGLNLKALPDDGGLQVYSLAEGRARVFGYAVDINTSRRLRLAAIPDLRHIANEPHLSTTVGSQRFTFDRGPGMNLAQVSITSEKTEIITHGVYTGAQDVLPDTSVLTLVEVKQGGTTYTPVTDYLLTAGKVDWTPGGAEPSPGSTYTVKYQYIHLVDATLVDDFGFTVTGAVSGTLVLATYDQKLPRFDRLCINTNGDTIWLNGVSSETNPQFPQVPSGLLSLAAVFQTWTTTRKVYNDGVRVVPMPQLASVESRLDLLMQLVAQQRLESNIHTREAGTKKGLFTDSFLDDLQRDAGIAQTAAIVRGELMLPIDATINQLSADITVPACLAHTNIVALEQSLRTGAMNINPYMSFAPVPSRITLTPEVDRWTDIVTDWAGPVTERFTFGTPLVVVGPADVSGSLSTTSSTETVRINTITTQIENLRPITINYSVAGFGAGEILAQLTFDGIVISQPAHVADSNGAFSGSFAIPAGVPSGTKRITITGSGGMTGSATFSGQGTLERQIWQRRTTIADTWTSAPAGNRVAENLVVVGPSGGGGGGGGGDPLAQTFTLVANTQVTGVALRFTAVPTTETRVQIRNTTAGFPNQNVLVEAVLKPVSITTGGLTNFLFSGPQMLQGGTEYAIVVLCDDATGAVAVAELGKFDATAQRWITSQPYTVGTLLSSSNASTWTAHQDRDLHFRLLRANFTETSHTIALGHATVTAATDLLLMAFADMPASQTNVSYSLTLPDATVVTVSDGQSVQLAAPITGNVQVSAHLAGTADFSPILSPGTQLVAGHIATTADYVTRAIPGGASVAIKLIYEALVPSGSTVVAQYKGIDGGDVWATIPVGATTPVDDGRVEFIHSISGINEASVHVRLVLTGTTAARPRVRDLRVIVL